MTSQPQRVGNEPLLEIVKNITSPRGSAIRRYNAQSIVIKRYSGLWCNAIEVRIKSLTITQPYAVETVAGQKPAAFTQLERCNNISGINLSTEQIDASSLEDYVTKYVAGRQDTGKQLAA